MTKEELINMAQIGNFPDLDVLVYKNQKGETISRDSFTKIKIPIGFDSYIDKDNIVREIVIRPANNEDVLLKEEMDLAIKNGPVINIRDIDCLSIGSILDSVYIKDQKNRADINNISWKVDNENLELVISIIEKCGMPTKNTLSEKQISAIWLVIQHSALRHQIKYLPILKKAANNGDLDIGFIAMLEDRILIGQGEPQIYGTQVDIDAHTGKYKLIETINPEYLNRRRKEVGLEPIEYYLEYFGAEFSVPQK